MTFKTFLSHPLTLFGLGIIIGIAGLAANDYYAQPSAPAPAPTRVAIAPRLLAPTVTATATIAPTETEEPTQTPEIVALVAEATPTAEFTATVAISGTLGATPTVTTTQPTIRRPVGTPTLRVTSTPTTTVAAKTGDSPYAAIDITGNWDKIGPNKQVWYKTGVETAFPLRGIIALDAYGKTGIGFAVFSPEQASDLNVATTPKGRGAYDKAIPTHDLIWNGGSPKSGTWYVLVTNTNAVPVDFKLISTFSVSEHKNCFQYWEYLPNGAYILWTECNRPGASPP